MPVDPPNTKTWPKFPLFAAEGRGPISGAPNLKANANFQQMQSDLSDIENKLAASRRFYNNAVQEYNTGIQQFPAALFAGIFGFSQRSFFDVGEDRAQLEQAPNVKF